MRRACERSDDQIEAEGIGALVTGAEREAHALRPAGDDVDGNALPTTDHLADFYDDEELINADRTDARRDEELEAIIAADLDRLKSEREAGGGDTVGRGESPRSEPDDGEEGEGGSLAGDQPAASLEPESEGGGGVEPDPAPDGTPEGEQALELGAVAAKESGHVLPYPEKPGRGHSDLPDLSTPKAHSRARSGCRDGWPCRRREPSYRRMFDDAVEVWTRNSSAEFEERIAAHFDVNPGRMNDVIKGRRHSGSEQVVDRMIRPPWEQRKIAAFIFSN